MIPLKDNIPTSRFPILTVLLIAVNLGFFAWQLSHSGERGSASSAQLASKGLSERDQLSFEYGAIPREVTEPGTYCGLRGDCGDHDEVEKRFGIDQAAWWLTLLTSMFMHAGILHIAGNMLFLWVFGNNIEDSMGRPRFLLFYLLAGLAAVYAQALLEPSSTIPTIGASGAVSGVLGAYILLHPRARVLTLVIIIFFVTFIEIPALVMLGIWFVLQALPAFGQIAATDLTGDGGVAYLAHVGGFVFGLVAIKLFADRHRRGESTTTPAH